VAPDGLPPSELLCLVSRIVKGLLHRNHTSRSLIVWILAKKRANIKHSKQQFSNDFSLKAMFFKKCILILKRARLITGA
jgi:hypothetical protein